ncbi:hypothetical protein IJI31_02975 [bacterium]|nr:hypothetical protein [bacterium]
MSINSNNSYKGLTGFTVKNISYEVNNILYKSRRKKKYELNKIFTVLTVSSLAVLFFAVLTVSAKALHKTNVIDDQVAYTEAEELIKNYTYPTNKHILLALDGTTSSSKTKRVLLKDPGGTLPSGRVTIKVIDDVRPNPFLPYKDYDFSNVRKSDIILPPEELSEGSDAERVMDTSVSGILYDTYNPSAIINIEGIEYLVKRGDCVNNYHILDINNKYVVVKLGKNVYKAGVGEILTQGSIKNSNIPNLEHKFGGAYSYDKKN